MTTLGPYRVHPAADAFPLIEGEQFAALVEDIKRHGLREPIVLTHDGETLADGRNRYRACEAAIIDPVFVRLDEIYQGVALIDYIVSVNLKRRHLNDGQLAFVALKLEPIYAATAKERQREHGGTAPGIAKETLEAERPQVLRRPQAREQAAAAVGGSGRGVQKAKKVKQVTPDLEPKVMAGQMSLEAAYRQAQDIDRDNRRVEPVPKQTDNDNEVTLLTHEGVVVPYPAPKKPKFNKTPGEGISWAHWSWNPVTGCLRGCPYCYARDIATSDDMARVYPVGFTPLFHHERLSAPANTEVPRGNDPAERRVFVCSMADLYGQWVPDEWIERVHAACRANPQWRYIHLTKNPARYERHPPPPGSWVGTSVDEQKMVRFAEDAARRIDQAAVKWLSVEPLREELRFDDLSMFDWVVIGAQTQTYQPNENDGRVVYPAFAPPFEWVARIVMQAKEAGCAVHMKPSLLGAVGPKNPGMTLLNEFPAERLRLSRPAA